MKLTKIALATSLAVAASSSFALEAMDDSTMGAVTGQDGITITLSNVNTTADVAIFDRDGLQDGTNDNEAAIVLDNMNITATSIGLDIDAGTADANDTSATLAIGVEIEGLSVTTGDIQVATVDGAGSFATANAETIIDSTTINIGALDLDIVLGDTGGESLITFGDSTISTIDLADFAINDNDGTGNSDAGALGAANIRINDLVLTGTTIDVASSGLVINTPANNIGSIEITDLYLGDSATHIGDVGISNISSAATTITISGH